jgi:hypothetical protein
VLVVVAVECGSVPGLAALIPIVGLLVRKLRGVLLRVLLLVVGVRREDSDLDGHSAHPDAHLRVHEICKQPDTRSGRALPQPPAASHSDGSS